MEGEKRGVGKSMSRSVGRMRKLKIAGHGKRLREGREKRGWHTEMKKGEWKAACGRRGEG